MTLSIEVKSKNDVGKLKAIPIRLFQEEGFQLHKWHFKSFMTEAAII